MRAGDAMGVTYHVASVLGSYGHTSPTYFPSPDDVSRGNDAMAAIADADRERVRWYVTVNPNHTEHALAEIERGVARGAIGVKLLASRRADDPLLDPICELAAEHGLPILHHIWQHRTREWPNQEISDGARSRAPRGASSARRRSSSRTSAAAATGRTRCPRCATCRTSIRISPAAAWIAA